MTEINKKSINDYKAASIVAFAIVLSPVFCSFSAAEIYVADEGHFEDSLYL